VPRYDSSDVFVLDGEQLTPVPGPPATRTVDGVTYQVARYRPRHEEFVHRIERWTPSTGAAFWRVIDRASIISLYGQAESCRVADPSDSSRVFEWLLQTVIYPRGDVRSYVYKQEDDANLTATLSEQHRVRTANRYIERICYGNDVAYAALNGGISPIPQQVWHFEVVFDYGEYRVAPDNDTPYTPTGTWLSRPDPFSAYKSGFERRTHRLCRNILMFHRFQDELGPDPVLVHTTHFSYDEDPSGTALAACQVIGYQHYPSQPAGQRYLTSAAPPIALRYVDFDPAGAVPTLLTDVTGANIEGMGGRTGYTVTDLYGDGVPGILYADGSAVSYRSPVLQGALPSASISWTTREPLDSFPVERSASESGLALADLNGDGALELLHVANDVAGYYRSRREQGWTTFTPFSGALTEYWNPNNAQADLDGDGRSDVIWKSGDTLAYASSSGLDGFGSIQMLETDPGLPPTLDGDTLQLTTFVDVLAGGVPNLVRITDGSVECWPSLGYGRFGAVVRLDNVPRFADAFDAHRVYLADINGSGAPSLIFAYADHVEIYVNLSGNAFATTPVTVPLPATYANPAQIRFEDLFGTGYQCLILTSDDPEPRAWYFDFCRGQKPYLLQSIDNNRGSQTEVTYRSSAFYYLWDKREGPNWITHIPFPMQVVSEVVTTDAISGVRTALSYRYHHGHYDHVEREFRGFGMVEHADVETAHLYAATKPAADGSFVEPGVVKTWYHTGVFSREQPLAAAYRGEYFAGDPRPYPMPPMVFDWQGQPIDPETERQAHVALSGRVLRQEQYGLDGSAAQDQPLSVTEYNYQVRLLQPATDTVYGSYFVHERENVEYQYERQANDPVVHQHFVLAVDDLGNVALDCVVAGARRLGAPDMTSGQNVARILSTETGWFTVPDAADAWIANILAERKVCEIVGAAASDLYGIYISFDALLPQVTAALAPGATTPGAVVVDWFRYQYVPDASTSAPVTPQELLIQREEAVFADAVIAKIFDSKVDGDLGQLLRGQGGYTLDSGFWWNPGYAEQYNGLEHFYLPKSTTDPLAQGGGTVPGSVFEYTYDPRNLLLVGTTVRSTGNDALPGVVMATRIDYQALVACQIQDENGNSHEARRDPLGEIVARSSYGSEWRDGAPQPVGFAPLDFSTPPPVPPSLDALMNAPGTYLGGAAEYTFVDPGAWQAGRGPMVTATLTATAYPAGDGGQASGPIQIGLTYHDGSGREVQQTQKVEPGNAYLCDDTAAPRLLQDGTIQQGPADPRWRASGRVRFNNKGQPFKEYEPFFVSTYKFIDDARLSELGAAPTLYYDGIDRVIRVETPEGQFPNAFFARREYLPWSIWTYDRDDTVKDSVYYTYYVGQSQPGLAPWALDALVKSAEAYNTPEVEMLDNLGHRCALRRYLTADGPPLAELYEYNTKGQDLWSADPRLGHAGLHNFEWQYALDGEVLQMSSADAGVRSYLRNAIGVLIYLVDSRGFRVTTTYDGLHRQVRIAVKGGDGDQPLDNVVEIHIYGDSLDSAGQPPVANPAQHNLIGQPWRRYDSAGLVETAGYALTHQSLATTARYRTAYRDAAHWPVTAATTWATQTAALDALLDADAYSQSTRYDALGRVVQSTDPAGNLTAGTFDVAGQFKSLSWTPAGGTARAYITNIQYDPREQRQQVTFGGPDSTPVISTQYTYDPVTLRLSRIVTSRLADAAVLQDLSYYFDPVGNLTHVEDRAPGLTDSPPGDSDYTFDALYRLVQAKGRALAPYTDAVAHDPSYAPYFAGPSAPNVEAYTSQYTYDDSDNLRTTTYTAPSTSWQTTIAVSDTSNRGVRIAQGPMADGADPTAGRFDANGNQIALDQPGDLAWSYVNSLQRVTAGGQTQYMLYDWHGDRLAKIVESGGENGQPAVVERTLYFGSLELYRRTTGGTLDAELHRMRIADVERTATVRLDWKVGGPAGGAATGWFQLTTLLESAVVEVDDGGRIVHFEEYGPFGTTMLAYGTDGEGSLSVKPRRYSDQERDAGSGLYYYGRRFYPCWLGRWVSPDPDFDADGLNLYRFVQNNPIAARDHLGLGHSFKVKTKHGIYKKVIHKQRAPHRSKFRYFRRVQSAYGGTRNIAMIKLVRETTNKRHVIYLMARSMGLGVRKLTLEDEHIRVGKGYKKRSHSEAVLRAALEVGYLRVGAKTYNLNLYTREYAASTNQGCGAQHENCTHESVPFLAELFYFANPYTGSSSAGGWEKKNNQHQRSVSRGDMESDDESEDEDEPEIFVDAIYLDDLQFRGMDNKNAKPGYVTGTPLGTLLSRRTKPRFDKSYKFSGKRR
jgi:insecticidal toxin complex protein TccC